MMSAENGDESTETSDGLVYFIAKITVADFEDLPETEKTEIIADMSGFIRTAGHFCEFAVLGFLSLNALRTVDIKMWLKPIYSWGFSVIYAMTDEIHQYFVPDRVCDIKDIAVDALGALTGVAAMCLLVVVAAKTKSRKSKNDMQNKDPQA